MAAKKKEYVQYGPVYDPTKAGKRGRGRPRGSKSKRSPLAPLKGKHHVILTFKD